jgi:hypothetical protein
MSDTLLAKLDFDALSASRLWPNLDRDTRQRAAEAFYDPETGDRSIQRGADLPIANAIRFRVVTVRKLPLERKKQLLATRVKPEEALATLLLQGLQLGEGNRKMLAAFLDVLKVPHDNGYIADDAEFDDPTRDDLARGAEALYKDFPGPDVDLYLVSLLAIDPDIWGELGAVLKERAAS